MSLEKERFNKWTQEGDQDMFNPPDDFHNYSKYYLGWMHSLRIIGFFNNVIPFWPETLIDKYEGYYFDKRSVSRECLTTRGESKLYCYKNGHRFVFQDTIGIEKIMKEAYKGQNLIYKDKTVLVP